MKYYVKSGELERIVNAKTPQEACEKAIETCKGETISAYNFGVDERGFRDEDSKNMKPEWLIPVDDVLKTVGFEIEEDEDVS